MNAFRHAALAAFFAVGLLSTQQPQSDPATSPRTSGPVDQNTGNQNMNRTTMGDRMNMDHSRQGMGSGSEQRYSGFLVDASCASLGSGGASSAAANTTSGASSVTSGANTTTGSSTAQSATNGSAGSPGGSVTSGNMSPRDARTDATTGGHTDAGQTAVATGTDRIATDPASQRATNGRGTTASARNGNVESMSHNQDSMMRSSPPRGTMRTDQPDMPKDNINSSTMDRGTPGRMAGGALARNTMAGAPPSGCSATSSTTAFALYSNGQVYKFDDASNQAFAGQIKSNEKLRQSLGDSAMATKGLMMTATGSVQGDTLHVKSIRRGK